MTAMNFYDAEDLYRMDLENTVYISKLSSKCTEAILEELCVQMGPVMHVELNERGYAFVEFADDKSALFACKMLDGIKLYGRAVTVHPKKDSRNVKLYADYLEAKILRRNTEVLSRSRSSDDYHHLVDPNFGQRGFGDFRNEYHQVTRPENHINGYGISQQNREDHRQHQNGHVPSQNDFRRTNSWAGYQQNDGNCRYGGQTWRR
ncbi:hypothetical protein L596_002444 [Steinernema carpocapsae]|uniref:RRM domain-containing protein n=1 Tax=Steinernema carpocapsae TaxID=34508 RepID=A0A4U8UPS1_STECR|nr:hypothetical protein L596_002444 [Steinernema carpocapsae]